MDSKPVTLFLCFLADEFAGSIKLDASDISSMKICDVVAPRIEYLIEFKSSLKEVHIAVAAIIIDKYNEVFLPSECGAFHLVYVDRYFVEWTLCTMECLLSEWLLLGLAFEANFAC